MGKGRGVAVGTGVSVGIGVSVDGGETMLICGTASGGGGEVGVGVEGSTAGAHPPTRKARINTNKVIFCIGISS
jgi:hypothetical protein